MLVTHIYMGYSLRICLQRPVIGSFDTLISPFFLDPPDDFLKPSAGGNRAGVVTPKIYSTTHKWLGCRDGTRKSSLVIMDNHG